MTVSEESKSLIEEEIEIVELPDEEVLLAIDDLVSRVMDLESDDNVTICNVENHLTDQVATREEQLFEPPDNKEESVSAEEAGSEPGEFFVGSTQVEYQSSQKPSQ